MAVIEALSSGPALTTPIGSVAGLTLGPNGEQLFEITAQGSLLFLQQFRGTANRTRGLFRTYSSP